MFTLENTKLRVKKNGKKVVKRLKVLQIDDEEDVE